jgi:HAD superfamily hydrolase (TIGR01509 family)
VPLTPPLETLFLDAGGVLVFPNWQRVAATLGQYGIDVPVSALRRAEPRIKFEIDSSLGVAASTDAKRWPYYLEGVLDVAGVDPSPARTGALTDLYAYHAANNLWEHVPDDVVPALERLRTLGLKLAIASNANGSLHRAFARLGLAPYFDTICDSCLEGVEKPDPRFFHIVLERSGSRPETTLHVGDLYHVDVVGARNTGLRAMLLDQHDLYEAYDVDRVRSLDELVDRIS